MRLILRRAAPYIIFTCAACILLVLMCVYSGGIIPNAHSAGKYPVRGVDVSHHQGEIDWSVLAGEGISFAFIKATEGSSFVDPRFEYNFREAQNTELRVGAYHFFSFDSPGETQADNFIATVPAADGMLPPVVDFEFYGEYAKEPPDVRAVQAELDVMLARLEAHYGVKPIIYTTREEYSLYLSGGYGEYDIWYRNVLSTSGLPDGRAWTFWQYTNRERLNGYNGRESYIDMNVFSGTADEFAVYGEK